MTVYLSARFASSGISSPTWRPTTLDWIGFQMPRYSSGASGFMSNMSRCGGPPPSQHTIMCFAFGEAAGFAWARMTSRAPTPQRPSPPTRRKSRRFMSASRGTTSADRADDRPPHGEEPVGFDPRRVVERYDAARLPAGPVQHPLHRHRGIGVGRVD